MNYSRLLLWTAALLIGGAAQAQSVFEGFARAGDNGEPVPNVYVVNKRTLKNSLSNANGFFHIEIAPRDTLVFSHLSFNYTYVYIPDTIPPKWVDIVVMEPRNYLLDEVSVFSYHLTTNQPRPIILGEPDIPSEGSIRYPRDMSKPSIQAPADLLYWYFGSRPRQLRELRRLQREDAYRERLRTGSNREILMEVTGLTAEELEAFAFSCKFGNSPISNANDYDLLISLLSCYQEYENLRKQQEILNDAEGGWGR